jgi:O-antigen/teichoic acid export membrane protein
VLAIGIGRARRTQFNWIVSGVAAALNIALNFALIPRYGMMGAAVSTAAAYVALFVGMTINSQHVYPVAYQWRRVLTLSSVAIALTVVGYASGSLALAIVLCLVYPLLLLPLGFYLPAERARLRRLVPLGS